MFETDKTKVGQFVADIRTQRKPNRVRGGRLTFPREAGFEGVLTHYSQGGLFVMRRSS